MLSEIQVQIARIVGEAVLAREGRHCARATACGRASTAGQHPNACARARLVESNGITLCYAEQRHHTVIQTVGPRDAAVTATTPKSRSEAE